MKKLFVFLLLSYFAVTSSVSAQTCDCENLQAQIDTLTDQVQTLTDYVSAVEVGTVSGSPAPTVLGKTFEEVKFDNCSVNCYAERIVSTSSGMTVLEVFMIFKNENETEKNNFASCIRMKAYQHDVGLLHGRNYDVFKEVSPGKQVEIRKTFIVLEPEGFIELEFFPLQSDQEPQTRIIIP